MDSPLTVKLTPEESAAVQSALQSYLRELRMEIADTDNPSYRRDLRAERTSLEAAVQKLAALDAQEGSRPEAVDSDPSQPVVRVVELWWSIEEG